MTRWGAFAVPRPAGVSTPFPTRSAADPASAIKSVPKIPRGWGVFRLTGEHLPGRTMEPTHKQAHKVSASFVRSWQPEADRRVPV